MASISATPQSPQTLQISPAACDGRDEGRGRPCSPARGLIRCSGVHVLLIFYEISGKGKELEETNGAQTSYSKPKKHFIFNFNAKNSLLELSIINLSPPLISYSSIV